ncbi:MAG: hypothetical protein ACFFA8_08350 [Promethearchaeota archaeon]
MAYVVVKGSFPYHVGREVGKKFQELEKLPDFVKIENIFGAAADDYTFFSIYKIEDESKYFNGIKAIVKRLSRYMDIVGYKYTLYPVLETKDALSIIGLG